MEVDDFKWQLASTDGMDLVLVCDPMTKQGKRYPYQITIWRGGLLGWEAEIQNRSEGETINYSDSDVLALMDKCQRRVMTIHEG